MEEIACIFCGTPSGHVVITENGYKGRKCGNCDLIYISPRPTAAEITHLYTNDHAVLYADAQFQFDRFSRMVAAATLAKIKKYKKGGALLELGPGGGRFLSEAREYGYEPYGIELNPIEARWISEELRIPCENVPLSRNSFNGRKFDIIYHKDVLSHLHDPLSVFTDMNAALNEGGLLVFETGNIGDVHERYYKYFSQFLYPDHLFFFGEGSINILLERTGFKRVVISRNAILFQLILQKALWGIRDPLKDNRVVEDTTSKRGFDSKPKAVSLKRRLRLLYRYVSHYLISCGAILPKNGRPLKLFVVAEKQRIV